MTSKNDSPDLPEGWLGPAEAAKLGALAAGKSVLEIGSYLGLSTVVLAGVAHRLVTVDHHRGSREHQRGGPCFDPTLVDASGAVDTLPRFLRNLRQNGIRREDVSIVVADITIVGPFLRSAYFGLVFIDGDHSTAAVERDAALAVRVVMPGGLVAFHDYNWSSVQLGAGTVSSVLEEYDSAPPSLAVFRRKEC